jgi:isopenicillin N synthase-like dioxygenase
MILHHQALFKSYTLHCRSIVELLLTHLNIHLHLPLNTLANLHRVTEPSGDHIRFTQSPPFKFDSELARKAQHTDFGSLTILFNWIGGLQIRRPDDTEDWVYVRPVPGSCIVNLGDALVAFTAGILRSNVHRVVPPPGAQAGLTRNSLVYFNRPEDKVVLKRLKGGLVDSQPMMEGQQEMTSEEWILAKGTGKLPGVYTVKGFEGKARGEFPLEIKA